MGTQVPVYRVFEWMCSSKVHDWKPSHQIDSLGKQGFQGGNGSSFINELGFIKLSFPFSFSNPLSMWEDSITSPAEDATVEC